MIDTDEQSLEDEKCLELIDRICSMSEQEMVEFAQADEVDMNRFARIVVSLITDEIKDAVSSPHRGERDLWQAYKLAGYLETIMCDRDDKLLHGLGVGLRTAIGAMDPAVRESAIPLLRKGG